MTLTILNNRYQVLHVLGSGGFGETFLAEDTQMPSSRRCVIKQLKPVVNNSEVYQLVQQRFQQEAAILEDLGEFNNQIPRLYAYFVENEQFYLVQEYIHGQTLTQKLQQQGLQSEHSVKEILLNTLPILEYIHSKHIVHRDIKPDNIILRSSDSKPVLIDFGAVKVTMGTIVTASGNSTPSIIIGTPGFMPMEQSVGRPVFSSDLYSLGLTAIYLLTGKVPQELPTNPATGDILWRNYAANVSPSFAVVLDKAIQQSPRDRYHTATEMLQALQASFNSFPPTIPVSSPQPTFITTPAPQPPVQPPTVVSLPPNQQQNSVQNAVSPANNFQALQQGVIIGGVIGVVVVGGLWLIRGQISNPPQPQATVAVSPTNSSITNNPERTPQSSANQSSSNSDSTNTSSNTNTDNTDNTNNTENPNPVPATTLTASQAKNLINNWLQAKKVMFAPPYDPQPAAELTTGQQYEKVAGTDGSINSLKTDGHYYTYRIQTIDNIDEFSVDGNQAVIQVKVTEDRTLFDSNGNILPQETDFKTRTVRYNLQFVNQRWKIASSDIIKN